MDQTFMRGKCSEKTILLTAVGLIARIHLQIYTCSGLHGQMVAAFIMNMSIVTAHPDKPHPVALSSREIALPEIGVLDILPAPPDPPSPSPRHAPHTGSLNK